MPMTLNNKAWKELLDDDISYLEFLGEKPGRLERHYISLSRAIAILKWCQRLTPEIVDDIDKVAKSMATKRKLYDGMVQHLTALHETVEREGDR